MKQAGRVLALVTMLVISAHRLPAPIVEDQETTVPTGPARSKTTSAKHKPSTSTEGNSQRRFEGTWLATAASKTPTGSTVAITYRLLIKGGSAEETVERISTLGAGATWPNVPAPYNTISPIHAKFTQKSSEVRREGSNLKIRWPGFSLTDWTPKTLPQDLFTKIPSRPSTDIYVLNGDRLIDTNGQTTGMWTRAR